MLDTFLYKMECYSSVTSEVLGTVSFLTSPITT